MPEVTVGISAFYHDSACCLLRDGELVAAAQEERFSRRKHDAALPVEAFLFCLEHAGIDVADVDTVAFYEDPIAKTARQLWSLQWREQPPAFVSLDPGRPERELRTRLGVECPIEYVPHHHSHAGSAYHYSGFDDAAVLVVDGVGEWSTISSFRGQGGELELLDEVTFPDSLGLFYSAITQYLGFGVNSGEYKVMGLAPYGRPTWASALRELLGSGPDGRLELDLRYFDFLRRDAMCGPELASLFGRAARQPGEPLTSFHADVARSCQCVLEEHLLELVERLYARCRVGSLCLAGGVALNCVANRCILDEGPFERVFVQPAAGDAGGALGAAAIVHRRRGVPLRVGPLRSLCLGEAVGAEVDEIARVIRRAAPRALHDFRGDRSGLVGAVADELARGAVVGWCQDRMEFGPRALGARSILADPRRTELRERINRLVKKREAFRPFAPAVLEERAADHFELDHPSPFMTEVCAVARGGALGAITHVDRSARVQTVGAHGPPALRALLAAFAERTGCPVLLNTSFNVAGMPIVRSAKDALECFLAAQLDALAIGDYLILRRSLPARWQAYVRDLAATADAGEPLLPVYTFF